MRALGRRTVWNLSSACHPFSIQCLVGLQNRVTAAAIRCELMASDRSTGHSTYYLKIRPIGMAESAKEIVAFDMEPPKKDARSVLTFKDAQAAIDGTLEAWLPRLVESNEALEEALLLLRDLHLARQSVGEDVVLKKV